MIEQKPNNNSCFLLLKQPSLKPSDQNFLLTRGEKKVGRKI